MSNDKLNFTAHKKSLIAIALSCGTLLAMAADLPNAHMTPGALNPNVTQANIHATICVKGFTKTIRPPVYFTNRLKRRQIDQYGYTDTNPKHYEEDHFVALGIGGDPTSERNLWPQPRNSEWNAEKKDHLEYVLQKMVCSGEILLAQAQHDMATNWISAYKAYVPTHSKWHYAGGAD